MGFDVVFLLGKTSDQELQRKVFAEHDSYGDIVQGDFVDCYRNLTYKTVMLMRWAREKCSDANFVLKIDDDMLLGVWDFAVVVNGLVGVKRSMWGNLNSDPRPNRYVSQKWYVSRQEYAPDTYPPFLSGTAYLISGDSIATLEELTHYECFFPLEDIYLTAIVADRAQRERLLSTATGRHILKRIGYPADLDAIQSTTNIPTSYRATVHVAPLPKNHVSVPQRRQKKRPSGLSQTHSGTEHEDGNTTKTQRPPAYHVTWGCTGPKPPDIPIQQPEEQWEATLSSPDLANQRQGHWGLEMKTPLNVHFSPFPSSWKRCGVGNKGLTFKYVTHRARVCEPAANRTSVLIGVISSTPNFEARAAIRDTWGGTALKMGFDVVFLLGKTSDQELQRKVFAEHDSYGDIVQGDFVDCYRNLTYKTVILMRWAREKCSDANFVLKIDDDMLLGVWDFAVVVNGLVGVKRSMWGNLNSDPRPNRYVSQKWYVSRQEYAPDTYPPFLSGTAYLISGDSIATLEELTHYECFFPLEDIYLTAIVADRAQRERLLSTATGRHILKRIGYPAELDAIQSTTNIPTSNRATVHVAPLPKNHVSVPQRRQKKRPMGRSMRTVYVDAALYQDTSNAVAAVVADSSYAEVFSISISHSTVTEAEAAAIVLAAQILGPTTTLPVPAAYGARLQHLRKQRQLYPPPHKGLNAQEARDWRQLQTKTFPKLHKYSIIFSEHYKDATAPRLPRHVGVYGPQTPRHTNTTTGGAVGGHSV
ncbi:hypothetical protein HPB49_019502 [Dermacentor silvarum]|uniref:Uncharacterized protein n=1 Tax=Dermacentor silvarum TaxID=543639 RepID=A0ACB8DJV2_DERSI|nr:hypothetical protein HPB49_019502 [Dermacentor silvarum]